MKRGRSETRWLGLTEKDRATAEKSKNETRSQKIGKVKCAMRKGITKLPTSTSPAAPVSGRQLEREEIVGLEGVEQVVEEHWM
jgi:hypothetical protein